MTEFTARTRQIMTEKPVSIPFTADLDHAYRLMKCWRIRHLPVVDSRGDTVGILSERDVERAMLPAEAGGVTAGDSHRFDPEQTVEAYMSSPVRAVQEGQPVAEAAEAILSEKLSSLLVVDQNGRPVGILTTDDLIAYLLAVQREASDHERHTVSALLNQCWLLDDEGYRE